MSEYAIMVQLDVPSGDRTWTLWIEAMRPTEQWVRLLYHLHGDNSPASVARVAGGSHETDHLRREIGQTVALRLITSAIENGQQLTARIRPLSDAGHPRLATA